METSISKDDVRLSYVLCDYAKFFKSTRVGVVSTVVGFYKMSVQQWKVDEVGGSGTEIHSEQSK